MISTRREGWGNAFALDGLGLRPVSRDDLLGHLRPASEYRVDSLPGDVQDGVEVRRYLVSGMRRKGVDVLVSLRLFLRNTTDPRIVLTIPGGAGRVEDMRIASLAALFDANHAVVDWVGRGQSGKHEGLAGVPDPLFMDGDTFRDCFQFYNLSGIWMALNWLFHAGYRPTDLVGGSWGGVYCFLMSALDDRVERIFPTFGCGGFVFPGIEKRSYWDVAIEHIGQARFREWCAAFDPVARIGDVKAEVFFETATNDKFFSLDMAMETWRRLERQGWLTFAYNEDHSMQERGLQPYQVQALPSDHLVLQEGRAAVRKRLAWAASNVVACSPVERSSARLVVSEQLPSHGNMSREWRALEPMPGPEGSARFEVMPTRRDSRILYYLDQEVAADGRSFKVATPVVGGTAQELGLDRIAPSVPVRYLMNARSERLLSAPIGDKISPRKVEDAGAWSISFTGQKRLRGTRFGVRPWRLPANWSSIKVELAEPLDGQGALLELVLSTMYNLRQEQACSHLFGTAQVAQGAHSWRYRIRRMFGAAQADDVRSWTYRFRRSGFARAPLLDGRFGVKDFSDGTDVTASFDAIGILDREGVGPLTIRIISIVIE